MVLSAWRQTSTLHISKRGCPEPGERERQPEEVEGGSVPSDGPATNSLAEA